LSGIPGSVGGTPVQNVGAYGQEVSSVIESVMTLDLRDGQLHELCAEACGFGYRSSIFNGSERGRYIILGVTYALTPVERRMSSTAICRDILRDGTRSQPSPTCAKRCAEFAPARAC